MQRLTTFSHDGCTIKTGGIRIVGPHDGDTKGNYFRAYMCRPSWIGEDGDLAALSAEASLPAVADTETAPAKLVLEPKPEIEDSTPAQLEARAASATRCGTAYRNGPGEGLFKNNHCNVFSSSGAITHIKYAGGCTCWFAR